ncbi:MAG: excinuclease ABC subunit UvrC [Actinobacteria bacterium]|uniref:Unannotated protein n=1 Tax=freshwater metagenome TaxID=449393 RepID=A0A6J7DWT1_9ZZZZ|nr:excinuclease ABC subunit UvrC [Actinomycetota bacterium]MSY05268.1 excinuclease ABC subunit UvrC [Actinomycetota bacterium]MSY67157.1 excinuclease ABC subunit UvrC [Actinomycetota bacterium]MTA00761.1 excinuclease ABC subunit UvrC [Actinomycetota bacterium]
MADPLSYRPENIPTDPGVYRFRTATGKIIYVGKAKNLRSRLSSYFQKNLPERTKQMVWSAASVDWTIVKNEIEALQLEFTWIRSESPRFNVVFRDDKSYPYLAVSNKDKYPRLFITRKEKQKDVKYFGPYPHAWALRELYDLVQSSFPIRSCSAGVFNSAKRSGRPCLLGFIDKCAAPCVGKISESDHVQLTKELINFLSEDPSKLMATLTKEMESLSANEEFEKAARIRDRVSALEKISTTNTVVLPDQTDADIFGLYLEEIDAAVTLFLVRKGRILGARSWIVERPDESTAEEIMEKILLNHYLTEGLEDFPREVLVSYLPESINAVEEIISDRSGHRIEVRVPQRGEKKELHETVIRNSQDALNRYRLKRTSDLSTRTQALAQLQESLEMKEAPLRIECFDISNLQGTQMVASMVVFEDGVPKKSEYRRFEINLPENGTLDDTAAINQVLTRRLNRLKIESDLDKNETDEKLIRKFAYKPQLIIVDGGKPQVSAAARALAGFDITFCGIAKRLEEVWLPNQKDPIIFPRNSEAMYLIQRIRDEAHRFAITYHRSKRSKAMLESTLEDIPGLGQARARSLITHFGSVTKLRGASEEQIAQLPGIGSKLAKTIAEYLGDTGMAGKVPAASGIDMASGEILDSRG